MIFFSFLLLLVGVSASPAGPRSLTVYYDLLDACFYDPFAPYYCGALRRKRTEANGLPRSSPELTALLNASAPLDSGFLTRVIKNVRAAASEEGSEEGDRRRRFFGAGYGFGIAFTAPLVIPTIGPPVLAGFVNIRLDFSVIGIEVNGAYSFLPEELQEEYVLGGFGRRRRGHIDYVNMKDFQGSFHTQETIGLWEIDTLLGQDDPEDEDFDLVSRRKEAFGKSLGYFDKQVTVDTAFIDGGYYFNYVTIGNPPLASSVQSAYLDLLGGAGIAVGLVGVALHMRKKKNDNGVNTFNEEEPALEAEQM